MWDRMRDDRLRGWDRFLTTTMLSAEAEESLEEDDSDSKLSISSMFLRLRVSASMSTFNSPLLSKAASREELFRAGCKSSHCRLSSNSIVRRCVGVRFSSHAHSEISAWMGYHLCRKRENARDFWHQFWPKTHPRSHKEDICAKTWRDCDHATARAQPWGLASCCKRPSHSCWLRLTGWSPGRWTKTRVLYLISGLSEAAGYVTDPWLTAPAKVRSQTKNNHKTQVENTRRIKQECKRKDPRWPSTKPFAHPFSLLEVHL